VRPHLIGHLLLICELVILQLARNRDSRWYYALPLLFGLWINLHSSFAVGIVVLAVAFACSFLNSATGLIVSQHVDRLVRMRMGISLALSGVALFANPIGPRLIWYPFDVLMNQPLNVASVSEWQPAPFSDVRAWALITAAGLTLLIPLVRKVGLRVEELVLILIGFGLAIQHERMLFLFGILTMPILCRLLRDTWDGYEPARDHGAVNGILLAIAVFAVVCGFPDARSLAAQVEQRAPARAVDFLARSRLSGPVLNEYTYGGYLIWAAPQQKVFIDGRADVYEPAGVLAEYGRWATVQEDPRLLLDKYRIRLCVVPKSHPISRVMALLEGWKTVYTDEASVVFARLP
jgi:hypothetical protein